MSGAMLGFLRRWRAHLFWGASFALLAVAPGG
jgi:hypothetical protein